VTGVIVALPVAVVTSWVLWERLVEGKEQKKVPMSSSAESAVERPLDAEQLKNDLR